MTDLGKFAVIGAIMGALLLVGLFGLLTQPAATEVSATATTTTTEATTPAPAVTVVAQKSLELLDPVYSEKGVFQDATIRVAFQASQDEKGVASRVSFWLHNVSHEVINVLWDRCSMQLPSGNTVSVMSEQGLKFGTGPAISVASTGDLFDAMIPMSEVTWGETGYEFSYGVLDQGIFTVVLAIERAKPTPPEVGCAQQMQPPGPAMGDGCGPQPPVVVQVETRPMDPMGCDAGREVVYYTFRFIIR